MSSPTRARLESLLQARKLDGTLTPSVPTTRWADHTRASTGVAPLDARLGGGVPRGQLSELVGPPSSGRTSLLLAVLAAATHRGELVALVDAGDAFDPESAAAAGVDLTRLLWVRTPFMPGRREHQKVLSPTIGPSARGPLDRSLKALGLILQVGEFGVVSLDLAGVPVRTIRRIPFTTWLRVQRALEGQRTVGLLLADEPVARSAAGLTIQLQSGQTAGCWAGSSGIGSRLQGLEIRARVVRARFQASDETVAILRSTVDRSSPEITG